MSQMTLDDEELFSEAAAEVREDVESALADARATLPAPADIWDVEADNTLGVLNALRSAADAEDAAAHLRDAKKWYTMGEKADAFDESESLAADIEAIEEVLDDLTAVEDHVADLASSIPELKADLEEVKPEPDADVDADTSTAEA